MIQEMTNRGERGWKEIDTVEDHKKALKEFSEAAAPRERNNL